MLSHGWDVKLVAKSSATPHIASTGIYLDDLPGELAHAIADQPLTAPKPEAEEHGHGGGSPPATPAQSGPILDPTTHPAPAHALEPVSPGAVPVRMLGMPVEAHLQMVQDVISRLAGQSTTVKGWSITVTGALLGYGASTGSAALALIAAWAVVAFAALDAYYLSLERAYRAHYEAAVAGAIADWDLNITPPTGADYYAAIRSRANLLLYSTALLTTAAIYIYLITR